MGIIGLRASAELQRLVGGGKFGIEPTDESMDI